MKQCENCIFYDAELDEIRQGGDDVAVVGEEPSEKHYCRAFSKGIPDNIAKGNKTCLKRIHDMSSDKFYKEHPTDQVWWVDTSDQDGQFLFSFDRKEVFNLFRDYPHKLTPEQKAIFDKENPYWKKFFEGKA